MSDSMFELEHKPGESLTFRFRPPKLRKFSPETREYMRTAQRQFLLAFRSAIDMALDMTGEPGHGHEDVHEEPSVKKGRKTKIKVE